MSTLNPLQRWPALTPALVAKWAPTLTIREEDVVRKLCGIGEPKASLKEIAMTYGLTPNRIGQIRDKAFRKISTRSTSKGST